MGERRTRRTPLLPRTRRTPLLPRTRRTEFAPPPPALHTERALLPP